MVATATYHKCQHQNSQTNVHTYLPNVCMHMLCFRNCIIHTRFLCKHALLFLWRSIQLHNTCKQFLLLTHYMNNAKHIPMQTHIHTSLLLSLSLSLNICIYIHSHVKQPSEFLFKRFQMIQHIRNSTAAWPPRPGAFTASGIDSELLQAAFGHACSATMLCERVFS